MVPGHLGCFRASFQSHHVSQYDVKWIMEMKILTASAGYQFDREVTGSLRETLNIRNSMTWGGKEGQRITRLCTNYFPDAKYRKWLPSIPVILQYLAIA